MINTEIWEPVPEKPGYVQYTGQRETKDVFRELQEFLQKENLMPNEYFQMDYDFEKSYPLFPKTDDFRCYAQWGVSEGIYLEVELLVRNDADGKRAVIPFATGKSLDESPDAFDRMQYIAGRIYRVFTSDDYVPEQKQEAERERQYMGVPDGIRAHFEGRDVYAAYGDIQYPQHVHMIERLSDGRYQALYNHEIVLEAGEKIGVSHTDGGIYATFGAAKKDLEKFRPTARLVYDRSAAARTQTEDFSAPKRHGRSI